MTALLKEAAIHDSEAASLLTSTSGVQGEPEAPNPVTSSDADLLAHVEPDAATVNDELSLESLLLSEPIPTGSIQETNRSDDLLDLLDTPIESATEHPSVKPQVFTQDAADLLLLPEVFADSSPRIIEEDELLRHLSAQDNNDVFL